MKKNLEKLTVSLSVKIQRIDKQYLKKHLIARCTPTEIERNTTLNAERNGIRPHRIAYNLFE